MTNCIADFVDNGLLWRQTLFLKGKISEDKCFSITGFPPKMFILYCIKWIEYAQETDNYYSFLRLQEGVPHTFASRVINLEGWTVEILSNAPCLKMLFSHTHYYTNLRHSLIGSFTEEKCKSFLDWLKLMLVVI